MNTTVRAGETRAPQKVTNVIIKIEMKAGVMNTKRSRAPPEYAKSDLESTEEVFRYPERFDSGLEAKAFAFFCVDPSIINPPPLFGLKFVAA